MHVPLPAQTSLASRLTPSPRPSTHTLTLHRHHHVRPLCVQVASIVGNCSESKAGREAAASVLVREALQRAGEDSGLSLHDVATLRDKERRGVHDDITAVVVWLREE